MDVPQEQLEGLAAVLYTARSAAKNHVEENGVKIVQWSDADQSEKGVWVAIAQAAFNELCEH